LDAAEYIVLMIVSIPSLGPENQNYVLILGAIHKVGS